jgi:hypothetical protein
MDPGQFAPMRKYQEPFEFALTKDERVDVASSGSIVTDQRLLELPAGL